MLPPIQSGYLALVLLSQKAMITSSITGVLFPQLSPKAESGLILFFFLFPVIWGAGLAVVATFEDVKSALGNSKSDPRR